MELNWDFPSPFTIDVTVQAEHIDGLNHTNNTIYVKWCEQAGWQHSCDAGLDLQAYQSLDRAMAIRHSEFDYLRAALLNEELIVGTWLTHSDGKLTMERRFQIIRLSDQKTLLRAKWNLVCIEISSGKPKRMPKAFIDIYHGLLIHNATDNSLLITD